MPHDPTTPRPYGTPRRHLEGKRFGRLIVMGRSHRGNHHWYWLCRCDCGTEKAIGHNSIVSGNTTSCGCALKAILRARSITHGLSGRPEYPIWLNMRERCLNPHNKGYPRYGGRGITICERWADFTSFFKDMGPRPSRKHSIERRDNDRGYDPDNCYWTTAKTQANNRRTNNRIEYRGETKSMAEWAEHIGIAPGTLARRLRVGWSVDRAFTAPIQKVRNGKHVYIELGARQAGDQ